MRKKDQKVPKASDQGMTQNLGNHEPFFNLKSYAILKILILDPGQHLLAILNQLIWMISSIYQMVSRLLKEEFLRLEIPKLKSISYLDRQKK